jgi:DNA end-binding protein Ku
MARSIWSGAVSFGLVNVPVKAYTAVRDHSVHFNQLEKGTGSRIRYKKVSDKTGKEVESDDIESGYEISPGQYVVFDPDELDELRPRTTRTIDITDFVELDEVDPIYYDHTYWLAPDGEAAERAYRLLLAAMEKQAKVGIGTVVMRNKQYLAAIRPLDGALALSTMRFADEVVPQSEVDALPGRGQKPAERELKLAAQIIDSLSTDWDPARYHDTYTEQLKTMIEAKAEGREIVAEDEAPADDNVLDLMAALQASLDAARKGGGKKLPAELAKAADRVAEEQKAGDGDGEQAEAGPSKKPAAKKTGTKKAAPKKAAAKKTGAKKSSAKRTAAKKSA